MFSGSNRCISKLFVLDWMKTTYMSIWLLLMATDVVTAVWGSKRLRSFPHLSPIVLYPWRLNSMKWLKWFRRLSEDKFLKVKLTPLRISVMYSLLDFVFLHPPLPHKIVNEIFLFCHCQSPQCFAFWNSSPMPSYPSALPVLCAQSSEWSLLSSCKLGHSHNCFF